MDINNIGNQWLINQVDKLTDELIRITPVEYIQNTRYLPESVTSFPGYFSFDIFPYWKEIIDCFNNGSNIREVAVMKGVQVGYTTNMENILFYQVCHIGNTPIMLLTADNELAQQRIENNIIPMFDQSGFSDIISSADAGNSRKTGKTKQLLQFATGGYLIPYGARNANKMRSFSLQMLLLDEIDAYPDVVGRDGDPITLVKDRCSGYWERRSIFYGSTPLLKKSSKIESQYLRGDQRKYKVPCKSCGFYQSLEWRYSDKPDTAGIQWTMNENNVLIKDSVCYKCYNCGQPHYEYDKINLFANGYWEATANPYDDAIRSYHLNALYSPVNFQPWYKCVSSFLDAYDVQENKVKDINKYQVFYNNVLGLPFEVLGDKVRFAQVSGHRRSVYRLSEIPNKYSIVFSGSPILMLTCTVDVHKNFLAVAVIGWAKDSKSYLIDYYRLEDEDCTARDSKVWGMLQQQIESHIYVADDNKKYHIALTMIDAGYANDTVVNFCSSYATGVVPVLGRDRPSKSNSVKEFAEWKTTAGIVGYRITVDHYKDRLSTVLRREWSEEAGEQKPYHFNAPVDIDDKSLKELTVESRREKRDSLGHISYYWYRPGNARNELFDTLIYGHAAVEILAYNICIQHFKLDNVDWDRFWTYLEQQKIYFIEE